MIIWLSLAALTEVAAGATPPRAPASPTIVIKDDSGFHWLDAGIGGAAVLAVLLMAFGLTLARSPRMREKPSTTTEREAT